MDLSVSAGYVGTATRGGYGDINLNYAESGGNANRVYAQQAGNANILLWGSFTEANYHSLQMALNRPFKNGLLLKGAYTWSKALNMADDDGRQQVTWPQPSQFDRNYAYAGYDRPHMLQLGFVYELPFAKESSGILPLLIKNWQVNGIGSWLSGTPFTVGGDNGLLQQQGGQQTANVTGELQGGFGEAGPDEQWYDPSQFSQPGNAWGNSGRNAFRGPSQLEPRLLAVPRLPDRPLPRRVPRRVHQRLQPHAVGEPGDRHHRSELHAHPHAGTRSAPRAAGTAVPVLAVAQGTRSQVHQR